MNKEEIESRIKEIEEKQKELYELNKEHKMLSDKLHAMNISNDLNDWKKFEGKFVKYKHDDVIYYIHKIVDISGGELYFYGFQILNKEEFRFTLYSDSHHDETGYPMGNSYFISLTLHYIDKYQTFTIKEIKEMFENKLYKFMKECKDEAENN